MFPFRSIIKDCEILDNVYHRRYRWNFIFPFVLTGWICLDTGIQYMIYGYDLKNLRFYHHIIMKFMPDYFINQSDVIYGSVFLLTLFCNAALVFDKMPHASFIMLQEGDNDGNLRLTWPYRKSCFIISKKLSDKLFKFVNRVEKPLKTLTEFLKFQLNLAFAFPLICQEIYKIYTEDYFPGYRIFMIAIECPFYSRYLFSIIHIGILFMYQNVIIQIKQKHYLQNMNLKKLFNKKSKTTSEMFVYKKVYLKFRKILANILDLTREIEAFNLLYSKYITATIILFGTTGCCVLNALINNGENAPILPVIPWT